MVNNSEEYRKSPAAREDAAAASRIIGDLISARLSLGLTQAQIAERMQTTQSFVSELEHDRGDCSLSIIQRYARAVGVRLSVKIETEITPKKNFAGISAAGCCFLALGFLDTPSAVQDIRLYLAQHGRRMRSSQVAGSLYWLANKQLPLVELAERSPTGQGRPGYWRLSERGYALLAAKVYPAGYFV